MSHYTARGQTLLFVDGTLAGTIDERLEPTRFALGGTAALKRARFRLLSIGTERGRSGVAPWRALLQASLEIYSPLDNVELRAGAAVTNLAQSMTTAQMQVGSH